MNNQLISDPEQVTGFFSTKQWQKAFDFATFNQDDVAEILAYDLDDDQCECAVVLKNGLFAAFGMEDYPGTSYGFCMVTEHWEDLMCLDYTSALDLSGYEQPDP